MNMLRWSWPVLFAAGVFMAMPKAHAAKTFPDFMYDVRGPGTTIGIGTNGTPVIVRAPSNLTPGGGWVQGGGGAATYAAGPGTAGGTTIAGAGTVPVGGKNVPAEVRGEISKADIAAAAVGCIGGTIVGCVAGVGIPLAISWLASSGTRFTPETGFERQDPKACLIGPCYEYAHNVDSVMVYYKTVTAALEAIPPSWNATHAPADWASNCHVVSADGYSQVRCDGPGVPNRFQFSLVRRTRAPDSATWYPATPQEVRDQLIADAAHAPPPAVVPELEKAGIDWTGKMKSPTITGPAEVVGPKTTTQNPDGSKTVSQEKTPLSYSGPTATAGPTVKKETKLNPDGSVAQETTTTTEPGTEAEDPEEAPPTDTPLPEIPKLYTRKYPEGIEGIWNAKKAELQSSPLLTLKDQLFPVLPSTGQCPVFLLPLDLASWANFGTHDISPPCWIWDFCKVVIVISAMLLARALIFGG